MLKLLRGSCLCSRKHVARPDPAKRFYSKAFAWTGGTRGSTGLYGYDVLKCASGFQAFAEEAIRKSEDLIERIRQMPPSMETISLFDELSDTVCTVVDSAELCRNTHSDSEFVEAASQASMTIYEYLNRLNTNSVLYDAIVKVENSNTLTTEEAKRAAFTHRLEFERGGVHLCNEKQEHIRKLRLQTTQLERKFMANILEDPGHIDIFPASRIPEGIKRMARQITKCEKGIIKQGLRLSTDSENLFSILKGVKDRERQH
ncbi:hypothetical protein KP509_16G009600 [Ceratopteris richardii]|uniref:Mitochondrial intermediate peptidase n=1 Tax=Ceratopteris richardii TaxID=49495 RepID=A0A8T2SXE4_CERRI|nr:hypothetical protein KP509_16G009600 [Ceratopteris richardii]